MHSLYAMWFEGKNALHHASYYNTSYRKMYWINGENCLQHDPVIPEETDIPLGYEGTGHSEMIVGKLN